MSVVHNSACLVYTSSLESPSSAFLFVQACFDRLIASGIPLPPHLSDCEAEAAAAWAYEQVGERQGYDMEDIPWAIVRGGEGTARIGVRPESDVSRGDYSEERRTGLSRGTTAPASRGRDSGSGSGSGSGIGSGSDSGRGSKLRRRLAANNGRLDAHGESRHPALHLTNAQPLNVDTQLLGSSSPGSGIHESVDNEDEDEGGNNGAILLPESDGAADNDGIDAQMMMMMDGAEQWMDLSPDSSAQLKSLNSSARLKLLGPPSALSEALRSSAYGGPFEATERVEGTFLSGLAASSGPGGKKWEEREGVGKEEGDESEGPFPPWVTGSDADNYPLTSRVQRDIWLHQHPTDCNHSSVR